MIAKLRVACVALALISIGLFPNTALSKVRRDNNMRGGLGYIKCEHIPGGKTRVTVRIIAGFRENPINAADLYTTVDRSNNRIFEPVIPATVDYKSSIIYEGYRNRASVNGSAYSIRLNGIRQYSFSERLEVECD